MKNQRIQLGIIGYGHRVRHIVKLIKKRANASVATICDIDLNKARSNAKLEELDIEKIVFFDSVDNFLENSEIDAVLIGTNCSTHTDIAIKVLDRGLPLFLEKPVSINEDQLDRLKTVAKNGPHKVVVSFPLRVTPWVKQVKAVIDSGLVGTIEHIQAVNNVPYGHHYFQSWYRDNKETGGMWLQKATHDFDYINYLIGEKPKMVAATISKQVFKGDHREGLYCKECSEKKTCHQSPYNPQVIIDEDEWMIPEQYMCAFAPDAANEDSGSCLMMYESGMHVVYSQNFFTKLKAGRRGARLMGCDGTIEFNWYRDEVNVYYHHKKKIDTYTISSITSDEHYGGDLILVENFISMIQGECNSISTLKDGISSAAICLAAKKSSQNNTFEPIIY